MFLSTYKTTLKNLFRAPIFWFMAVMIIVVAFRKASTGFTETYNFALNTMISDKDPRFLVSYGTYIKYVMNACITDVMRFAVPIFTIVSTVLVLNRDYGDNFYEIEKGANINPAKYLFGRIAALITVCFPVTVIGIFFNFHYYILSRGGLGWSMIRYITDSTVRVGRAIIFIAFPSVLMYIGLTYFIGCLFKSGHIASMFSLAYMTVFVLSDTFLMMRFPSIYNDYLAPLPKKVVWYFWGYDTSDFEGILEMQDTSLSKVILCLTLLIGTFILCSVGSFLFTRKRDR